MYSLKGGGEPRSSRKSSPISFCARCTHRQHQDGTSPEAISLFFRKQLQAALVTSMSDAVEKCREMSLSIMKSLAQGRYEDWLNGNRLALHEILGSKG